MGRNARTKSGKLTARKAASTAKPPSKTARSPKNIVILCDGTGNSASKQFKTNVWRLYQALDMEGTDQIATFSDGVGTSSFRPWAVIGLALGFGVKNRVIALYKYLCLNYRPGDRIYVFGFSRGAFIARLLVGMIFREGLVKRSTSEQVDIDARAAYRSYRRRAFKTQWWQFWVHGSRAIIDLYQRGMSASTGRDQLDDDPTVNRGADIPIQFLGVWDTVAAYGLPIEELTHAVDKWVWPLTFTSYNLLDSVRYARQAFAIDDERRTFFPIPFNEGPELTLSDHPRLRQVWFAGAHSNIGGGYPDDRLSMLPLCWMIGEAARCGLKFDAEIVADYWDEASPNGRLYDPRSGLGLTYRYQPRPVQPLMKNEVKKEDGQWVETTTKVVPLVDSSVIQRIARGADAYAPIDLPTALNVMSPTGRIDAFAVTEKRGEPPPAITNPVVDPLPQPAGRVRDLAAAESEFQRAKERLRSQSAKPVSDQVELVRDLVWWRQVVYFATVLLFTIAALFPLVAGYLTNVDINSTGRGIVGPVLGILRSFLPRFLDPWLDAVTNNAYPALILALFIAMSLWLNARLATRIRDRARAAWDVNPAIENSGLEELRRTSNQRSALNGAVGFGIAALLAFVLQLGASWIFTTVAALFGAAYALMRQTRQDQASRNGLLGRIARAWRDDAGAASVYGWTTRSFGPAVFLAAALLAAVILVNKFSFELFNAAGAVCADPVAPSQQESLPVHGEFSTSDPCWSSGATLQAGVTYDVHLTIDQPWLDKFEPADVHGFQAGQSEALLSKLAFYIGNPFKRWWSQPYFKPILRIGRRGNEEYPLNQLQPIDLPKGQAKTLVARVKPETTGPVYLYVNDIGVGIPGLFDWFYRMTGSGPNRGTATVRIERTPIAALP